MYDCYNNNNYVHDSSRLCCETLQVCQCICTLTIHKYSLRFLFAFWCQFSSTEDQWLCCRLQLNCDKTDIVWFTVTTSRSQHSAPTSFLMSDDQLCWHRTVIDSLWPWPYLLTQICRCERIYNEQCHAAWPLSVIYRASEVTCQTANVSVLVVGNYITCVQPTGLL